MTWNKKLSVLSDGNKIDEVFLACNFSQFPPVPSEVDKIARRYEWLPSVYLEFLNITNGAQFGTFVLFGVKGETITTLESEIKLWDDSYSTRDSLPIGKDATGNPILLRENGSIYLGSLLSTGESQMIADCFETLLDRVFLGDGYSTFMNGNIEGDEWYEFLVEQKWINLASNKSHQEL